MNGTSLDANTWIRILILWPLSHGQPQIVAAAAAVDDIYYITSHPRHVSINDCDQEIYLFFRWWGWPYDLGHSLWCMWNMPSVSVTWWECYKLLQWQLVASFCLWSICNTYRSSSSKGPFWCCFRAQTSAKVILLCHQGLDGFNQLKLLMMW